MSDSRLDYIFQYYIRSIDHNLKRILDEHLIPYDITNQQARIVGFISDKVKNGSTINQKDIETAMNLKGSSITSLLKGLERKGFITRMSSSKDARSKELSLTKKGETLINEFNETFIMAEEKLTSGMTKEQKETFLLMLQLVNKNVEQ
jgi:DNA-binding MarR family transcriptional regulator